LNNTEKLVQSYNKLQPSLEGKKEALEEFQTHLQTLFDWQKELDILNGKAQVFQIYIYIYNLFLTYYIFFTFFVYVCVMCIYIFLKL